MDIRNWPLDRIMQLPDWCFGRRWPIGVVGAPLLDNPTFDISEAALPDITVIWGLYVWSSGLPTQAVSFEFALGDHLPATDAEFWAMEPLFSGVRNATHRSSSFLFNRNIECFVSYLRMAVKAQGRRLVVRGETVNTTAAECQAVVVISSMPTEVPDWLISGRV